MRRSWGLWGLSLAVYAFLFERLGRPGTRALGTALNWAIVRGSAGSLTVILNVRLFDARVVRAGKNLVFGEIDIAGTEDGKSVCRASTTYALL